MVVKVESKQVLCELISKMIEVDSRLNVTLVTLKAKNIDEASHKAFALAKKLNMNEIIKEYKPVKPAHTTVNCKRCGGEGASERWAMSGKVCYECKGSGVETVTLATWKKRMDVLAEDVMNMLENYAVELNFTTGEVTYHYGLTADQAKKEVKVTEWEFFSKTGKINGKQLQLNAWYDKKFYDKVVMSKTAFEMKKFVEMIIGQRVKMIEENIEGLGRNISSENKEMINKLNLETERMIEKLK